jgi:acyl-coenzyme A thioesterase PaaI-like protein
LPPFDDPSRLASRPVASEFGLQTLPHTAAMAAAWAIDEVPSSVAGSTVSLSVNFVAAATGQDLRASARVRWRGGRSCFVDVDVTEPDGRLVAQAMAVYRLG